MDIYFKAQNYKFCAKYTKFGVSKIKKPRTFVFIFE